MRLLLLTSSLLLQLLPQQQVDAAAAPAGALFFEAGSGAARQQPAPPLPALNGGNSEPPSAAAAAAAAGRSGAAPEPPSSFVSVVNFGAVGDGIHDDTDAFIDALATSLGVFIPNGTYLIRRPLELRNKQTLRGAGEWHSQLIFNPLPGRNLSVATACITTGKGPNITNDTPPWGFDSSTYGVTVEQLGIEHLDHMHLRQNAARVLGVRGIDFTAVTYSTISHVRISQFHTAIFLSRGTESTMNAGCWFNNVFNVRSSYFTPLCLSPIRVHLPCHLLPSAIFGAVPDTALTFLQVDLVANKFGVDINDDCGQSVNACNFAMLHSNGSQSDFKGDSIQDGVGYRITGYGNKFSDVYAVGHIRACVEFGASTVGGGELSYSGNNLVTGLYCEGGPQYAIRVTNTTGGRLGNKVENVHLDHGCVVNGSYTGLCPGFIHDPWGELSVGMWAAPGLTNAAWRVGNAE